MVFTVLGRPLWSLQEADWLLCGNNFFVGNHSALCGGGEGHGREGATFGGVTLVLGKKGKGRN